MEQWSAFMDEETAAQGDIVMYVVGFAFCFCCFFMIVFFNTALTGCAMLSPPD